jgi:hypothetical protein
MIESTELFETAMSRLQNNYPNFLFFQERDIVWTIQTYITEVIKRDNLPFKIFHDYPILPGKHRSFCADLAIVNENEIVEVAVEFKYEPSHRRNDILRSKFPVVFWNDDGVGKDIERIHEFVSNGKTKVAYSVFIDEGGYFRHRPPHPRSKWIDWNMSESQLNQISVLWSQAMVGSVEPENMVAGHS